MNLLSGHLYFINELDIKTGQKSEYYKVGIVKESAHRDSQNRLLEHQTGNPRKLYVVETIQTPAVEYVESTLHYLFASNRVMGEWMRFSDDELSMAIDKAKEMSSTIANTLQDIEESERLKKIVSNGLFLPASDLAEEMCREYHTHKKVIDYCTEAINLYKAYVEQTMELGTTAPGVATKITRAGGLTFNINLFKDKYPNLYATYSKSLTRVSGNFRVRPRDVEVPKPDVVTNLVKLLQTNVNSIDVAFELHEKHLAVLEVREHAKYGKFLAEVKLRALTGGNNGIETVTLWQRTERQVLSLDEEYVKANYPDEFNACMVQRNNNDVVVVNPRHAQH